MSGRWTTTVGACVFTERLGGDGHDRFAARIPMQGALFASSAQFLEGAVQDGVGHQFGGHEGGLPHR